MVKPKMNVDSYQYYKFHLSLTLKFPFLAFLLLVITGPRRDLLTVWAPVCVIALQVRCVLGFHFRYASSIPSLAILAHLMGTT